MLKRVLAEHKPALQRKPAYFFLFLFGFCLVPSRTAIKKPSKRKSICVSKGWFYREKNNMFFLFIKFIPDSRQKKKTETQNKNGTKFWNVWFIWVHWESQFEATKYDHRWASVGGRHLAQSICITRIRKAHYLCAISKPTQLKFALYACVRAYC